MKKNLYSILSVVLSVLSYLSLPIAPIIFKAGAIANSLSAKMSEVSGVVRNGISMQAGIASLGILFGIVGLIAYKRNKEIKGNVLAIIGIILGVISFLYSVMILALSSSTSSMIPSLIN